MQDTNNPLIFVLLTDQNYYKQVVNYLNLHKFTNIENYLSGEEVLKNMYKNPVIVIQDYYLDKYSGIELMTIVKKSNPTVQFIFLSEKDDIDIAINCMKSGAGDYIVKDQMALHKVVSKIQKINTVSKLTKTNSHFKLGVVLFFVLIGILVVATLVLMIHQD